jgi:hypothetical protein
MPIYSQSEYLNESSARGSYVSKLHRYLWVVVATNLKVIAIALLSIPIVNVYFFGEIEKMTTSTLMKKLSMATVGAAVVALGAVDSAQALQFSFSYNYENLSASGIFETTDNLSQIQYFGNSYDAYQILGISNGLRNGAIMDLLPPRSYMNNDNFFIPELTSSKGSIGPFFTASGFSFLVDNKTYNIYSNGFNLIESEARPDGGISGNNFFITNFSVTPVPVSPEPVPEPTTLLGYLVGGAMVFWKKRKKACLKKSIA